MAFLQLNEGQKIDLFETAYPELSYLNCIIPLGLFDRNFD